MMKSTEISNIPKLRFSQFDNPWKRIKLGDVASFSKGKGISKSDIDENGATQCIRYGELYTTYGVLIDDVLSLTSLPSKDLVLSDGDEVIIPASGESALAIATASVVRGKNVALGGDLNIVKSTLNPVFLAYYLNYKKKLDLAKVAQGSSVVHLYSTQLSKLNIYQPLYTEQQKIAEFLTSVDDKLNKLRRKSELLVTYKHGLMQKLFSQEIRFKQDDGSDFPDWEEKPLEDVLVAELRQINKPNHNYLGVGIRSHMKGTFQKPNSDPSKIAMDKLFTVHEGDLIVNITFAWEGAIAIVKPEDNGGLVSHRFPTYRFKEDTLLKDYFRYVITEKKFKFFLDMISPGGAGRNRVLSKKDFLKIRWDFPSVNEQKKIAEALLLFDKKIAATDNQITQLETFKKGLLQQMFV